jgi:hypothetical protein
MWECDDLLWRGHHLYDVKKLVAEIILDDVYPNMWRIKFPDGTISDLFNKTRAKDNAAQIALYMKRHGFYPRFARAPKNQGIPPV